MNNKLFTLMFIFAVFCLAAPKAFAQNPLQKNNHKMAQIEYPLLDIEARYWAWHVTDNPYVDLEGLKKMAKNWIGEKELKAKQWALIEHYYKNPKPLTPKEHALMDEATIKKRGILSPEKQDNALVAVMDKEACFNLSARYWAYSMEPLKNFTYDEFLESADVVWPFEGEREHFINKINDYIKNPSPLEPYEDYAFGACSKLKQDARQGQKELNQTLENKTTLIIDGNANKVIDIDAKYKAHMYPDLYGPMTKDQFIGKSRLWDGSPEYKEKLVNKIMENVNNKTAAMPSKEEFAKLNIVNETNEAVAAYGEISVYQVLGNQTCFNLAVDYWADFVVNTNYFTAQTDPLKKADELAKISENWAGDKTRTKLIMQDVKQKIKTGSLVRLRPYDGYIFAACEEKFQDTCIDDRCFK